VWAVVGLCIELVLLVRLALGSTSGSDQLLWVAALVAVALTFIRRPRVGGLPSVREHGLDVLVLALIAAAFVALNVRDLTAWYYAVIGDEYPFFGLARDMLQHGVSRPFSQAGVFDTHPVLNSAYQALVMAVFGADYAGWKLASVLSVVLALPGVYVLGFVLGGRAVAILATVFFASSHVLFAFAHIGYNNLDGLAPAVWAIALCVIAIQRRSPALLYLAGVIAGLGFYTFFSARLALPIIGLFVLTQRDRWRQLIALWPLGLGFALAAAPIVVVSRWELVSRMVAQVPGGYSSDVTGPVSQRLLSNLATNLLAFNYDHDYTGHYVSGSLLDPVTACLAVLGVGLGCRYVNRAGYRLLLIWFAVGLFVMGVLSPYPTVPDTRLNFCLPPLVLLAALAVRELGARIGRVPNRALARGAVWPGVLLLGGTVLTLNLHRFWVETPGRMPANSESLAVGAFRSPICASEADRTVIVDRAPDAVLRLALESYAPGADIPRLVAHAALAPSQPLAVDDVRCVVFTYPNDDVEREALAELTRSEPSGQVIPFPDRAGQRTVMIFVPGG